LHGAADGPEPYRVAGAPRDGSRAANPRLRGARPVGAAPLTGADGVSRSATAKDDAKSCGETRAVNAASGMISELLPNSWTVSRLS